MAANNKTTFNLQKYAYVCTDNRHLKKLFEGAPPVDVQRCCRLLVDIIDANQFLMHMNNSEYPLLDRLKASAFYEFEDERGICEEAALHGHLDCLKFAQENGVPWDSRRRMSGRFVESACELASISGSYECLVYAHENGSSWDERTCAGAAKNGHLECLIYARWNGCPWDVGTCKAAAQHGNLRCLEYAHRHGCPWDSTVLISATTYKQKKCVNYALRNGLSYE